MLPYKVLISFLIRWNIDVIDSDKVILLILMVMIFLFFFLLIVVLLWFLVEWVAILLLHFLHIHSQILHSTDGIIYSLIVCFVSLNCINYDSSYCIDHENSDSSKSKDHSCYTYISKFLVCVIVIWTIWRCWNELSTINWAK